MTELEITKPLLSSIAKLPRGRRDGFLRLLGKIEFDRCAKDAMYWFDATRHDTIPYVFTQDPHPMYACTHCHDGISYSFNALPSHRCGPEYMQELPSTRPFTLFPYLPPIIDAWLKEPMLAWEKSRDMMATWTTVALFTWDTFFHEGRQNIFQSDDSTKTAELVKRAAFICKNQPSFLRNHRRIEFSLGQTRSGELKIGGGVENGGSEILGFPQGPDQIRQYHPSGIMLDEAAFQIEAGEAFAAIKPSIQNGGRCTMVSTANPSFFFYVCRDRTDEIIEG